MNFLNEMLFVITYCRRIVLKITTAVWAVALVFTTVPAFAETYRYVDWLTANVAGGSATGRITLSDGSVVTVTFQARNPDGSPGTLFGAQTNVQVNYWIPSSPYISASVSNAPPDTDILQLAGGLNQTYTVTLSEPIVDPIMAIVSLGSATSTITYNFNAPFTIVSQGVGWFGGSSTGLVQLPGNILQGTEGNGTIKFTGAVSVFSWTVPITETWHGFTFGIRNAQRLDVATCTLGNSVWNDVNNNGMKDSGEAGLSGLTVRLLDASGAPTGVSTTTDANGLYQFTNLAAATYIVEVVPPAGFVSSTGALASSTGPFEPGVSSFAASTNDTDHGTQHSSGTVRSAPVTLSSCTSSSNVVAADRGPRTKAIAGGDSDSIDFGLFRPASVGNLVWLDNGGSNSANANNGRFDSGESGQNGVTVRLLDGTGGLVASRVTANNPTTGLPGWYSFGYLIPGNYQVEFVLPTGFVFSQQGSAAITTGSPPDTSNSQPTAASPRSPVVTLVAGDNNFQLDAGLVTPPVVVVAPAPSLPVPVGGWVGLVMAMLGLLAIAAGVGRRSMHERSQA